LPLPVGPKMARTVFGGGFMVGATPCLHPL
jgi:hypothetical protein